MPLELLTIASRFCGPPRSGNGGYVCGRVARHIAGPATVRLLSPPPLETPLHVESEGDAVVLRNGPLRIAEARPASLELMPPAAPSFSEAAEASKQYLGFRHHSFPGCFVCGPHRSPGDGLRIFAGPVTGAEVVASPWVPDLSLMREGRIAAEFLWAALDCPGAFAALPLAAGRTIVLGELSARIDGEVRAGERCVAIGWPIATERRKRVVGSALLTQARGTVAVARATWIEVAQSEFGGVGPA